MALSFPNPSRSFDPARKRVRFWGYDNAIEVSFVVEEDTLRLLCPDMDLAELGFLEAFDAERGRIHEVADQVYSRGRKRCFSFCLTAKDF